MPICGTGTILPQIGANQPGAAHLPASDATPAPDAAGHARLTAFL
jgi:hypothetical protein